MGNQTAPSSASGKICVWLEAVLVFMQRRTASRREIKYVGVKNIFAQFFEFLPEQETLNYCQRAKNNWSWH